MPRGWNQWVCWQVIKCFRINSNKSHWQFLKVMKCWKCYFWNISKAMHCGMLYKKGKLETEKWSKKVLCGGVKFIKFLAVGLIPGPYNFMLIKSFWVLFFFIWKLVIMILIAVAREIRLVRLPPSVALSVLTETFLPWQMICTRTLC